MNGERDVNRGVITLSPVSNDDWIGELIVASQEIDRFHICSHQKNSDGSHILGFCDGESCPEAYID